MLLAAALGLCGGCSDPDAGPASDGGPSFDGAPLMMPFTIIVLPDTQYYSSSYPAIFDAQTRWIVANKETLNIAFVLHEGDIVDSDTADQWQRASQSLHRLDGVVPYFLAPGNHDYSSAQRASMINTFFPVSGFAGQAWFGGTYEPDRIENNYGIVPVMGGQWLVLALEFGPRDGVLAWADGVLAQHPDLPAIVVTHAYLYNDGTRYDHVTRPDQLWSPYLYGLEDVNDAEEMWQGFIEKHDNVRFVFSGHVLPPDSSTRQEVAAHLTSMRPSGADCHQIVANYQLCAGAPCASVMGGNGYLRILQVEPATHRVSVRTFSPYLNRYKTDPENEFVLAGDD
jgi:hypothetical protein